jgi:hypothetical protein
MRSWLIVATSSFGVVVMNANTSSSIGPPFRFKGPLLRPPNARKGE